MQFFSFLTLAIFLVVAQTTFMHFLPHWLGRPDFIYILVAFFAYRMDWARGGLLVFITGWMLDVLSGVYLGAYVIECSFVFICLKVLTQNSPVRQSAYQIPLVGVSYFLVQFLIMLFYTFTVGEGGSGWSWRVMIQETIIVVFASIPCFLPFNKLFEFIEMWKASSKISRKRVGSNRFR